MADNQTTAATSGAAGPNQVDVCVVLNVYPLLLFLLGMFVCLNPNFSKHASFCTIELTLTCLPAPTVGTERTHAHTQCTTV